MRANAQRDGRPAEHRWRPLFNAAVWLCSNAAKKRNPLKCAARDSLKIQDANNRSGDRHTTLLGYIFATKAHIDNRKKKLVKQQYLLQMSPQIPTIW